MPHRPRRCTVDVPNPEAVLPGLTGITGAATAAYSVAALVSPDLLLRPGGLERSHDSRALTRLIAARDTGIGLAMVLGPRRRRPPAGGGRPNVQRLDRRRPS